MVKASWHLLPKGAVECSSATPADSVQAYRSPLGERIVVRGHIGDTLRYTQVLTLWHGVDRVDTSTTIRTSSPGRTGWCACAGRARCRRAAGQRGRRRRRRPRAGLMHDHATGEDRAVDSAEHPGHLDNPAHGWFGLSSAVRIRIGAHTRAVSVAEVVAPSRDTASDSARELMVALVRAGVTATCGSGLYPRYGHLEVDSNLPDARIALGGPDETLSPQRFSRPPTTPTLPNCTANWRPPGRPGSAPAATPLSRSGSPTPTCATPGPARAHRRRPLGRRIDRRRPPGRRD